MSGSGVQVDGVVRYRSDNYGARIAVLPATCRRGIHRLAVTGYRATEGNGLLRVRCDACSAETTTDAAWLLSSSGPLANSAELDDAPYVALITR
jgi:hypothetical protein